MGVNATYTVQIDTDKDGTFATTITNTVLSASWSYGVAVYGEIGTSVNMSVELFDPDGNFSNDDAGALYYGVLSPLVLVRLRGTYGATTETLFSGRLLGVQYANNETINPRVILSVDGFTDSLRKTRVIPELLQNVRTDEAIAAVMVQAAPVLLPHPIRYPRVGAAIVGESTLPPAPDVGDFEEGRTVLQYAGDVSYTDTDRDMDLLQYIGTLVKAEAGGRFFYSPRRQKFVYHNRNHDALAALSPSATFAGEQLSSDLDYGRDLGNFVRVLFEVREVGGSTETLGQVDSVPVALRAGASRSLRIRYRDPDNEDVRVAGIDIITPALGTDILINTAEDGSGSAVTTGIVLLQEIGATGAKMQITNETAATVYVTLARVRGKPLRTFKDAIEVSDVESIQQYGVWEREFDVGALGDIEDATNFASAKLAQFKTPRTFAQRLSYEATMDATRMNSALTLEVGDCIRVQDVVNGHDALYTIVGEQHTLNTTRHMVTYTLQASARSRVALVGSAIVGVDVVAF